MGYYLEFDGKENNTKTISYPMANLIRDLFPKVPENDWGWKLKKKHVAALTYFTRILLESDKLLKSYIDEDNDWYGFEDCEYEEIRNNIDWMYRCFADTLARMVLKKEKHIKAVWV